MRRCKYCGEEIGIVVPEPLTCWSCYLKPGNRDKNIKNTRSGNKATGSKVPSTKKCEMCGKVLPISNFYRTGNTHLKNCKECMVKDKAQKCLDNLKVPIIRKMAISGITAKILSKEWNKTRNTTQHYLSDLVKAGYGYKKEINGVNTYFLKTDLAEKLIADRNLNDGNEILTIVKSPFKKSEVSQKSIENNRNLKSKNENTKKCEVCKKVLPIDEFYKMGNAYNKMCKSCVRIATSRRCLESLTHQQITKMSQSGITAEYLAKELGKSRSTCQSMLASLVKTEDAYKKVVKGKYTYFMDKDKADQLLRDKIPSKKIYPSNNGKSPSKNQLKTTASSEIIFNEGSSGMIAEKISNKGILIKNLDIYKLGTLIQALRSLDSDFNFEITTKGKMTQIALGEDQIIRFAYKNIISVLSNFEKQ